MTILIVDDATAIREALARVLAGHMITPVITTATTVPEAVDAIVQQRPHFAVLDFNLADGTALDILRQVRGTADDTTFLVWSGALNSAVVRSLLAAGADHVLEKPRELNTLLDLIRSELQDCRN